MTVYDLLCSWNIFLSVWLGSGGAALLVSPSRNLCILFFRIYFKNHIRVHLQSEKIQFDNFDLL